MDYFQQNKKRRSLPLPQVFIFKQVIVYYESLKREVKTNPIYEFRFDERLQTKVEEFTRLTYTLLCAELEQLKIETRLIGEQFASVKGECEI